MKITKITAIALAMIMLAPLCITTSATNDAEWTYDNSILVTVTVAEDKAFTPADFAEVDCREVYVVDKKHVDSGYQYELLMVLNNLKLGDYYMQNQISVISENPIVSAVKRNYYTADYDQKASNVRLNQNLVWLKVGESVDLYLEDIKINSFDCKIEYIILKLDPSVIDFDTIDADYFSDCGVELSSFDYGNSATTTFYAHLANNGKNDKNYILAMTKLCQAGGVLSACFGYQKAVGNYPYEWWTINNKDIASMTLSGGEEEVGGKVYQIATVTGVKEGMTYVTVTHSSVKDTCVINVYLNEIPVPNRDIGDVNDDGVTDNLDAAYILKYDAGIIEYEDFVNLDGCLYGDVNNDEYVDNTDASIILQRDAGII